MPKAAASYKSKTNELIEIKTKFNETMHYRTLRGTKSVAESVKKNENEIAMFSALICAIVLKDSNMPPLSKALLAKKCAQNILKNVQEEFSESSLCITERTINYETETENLLSSITL